MFLTESELADASDRTQPAAQIRWLKRQGIPFLVSASGRPKVRREDLIVQPKSEPRWSKVR